MTDRDTNWKKHLLRTSVPLEHQAARALSDHGFSVSEYPYHRSDDGVEKEFSVDVRGVKTYGPSEIIRPPAALDVLVECKYRDRGAKWLFLPQPKRRQVGLQEAVQYVDLFSPRFVHEFWWFDKDNQTELCYSGVEVGNGTRANGVGGCTERARDSQLRHGARQLQYALPALIAMRARWSGLQGVEENFPFFFVAILVTNATLVVARPNFDVAAVEAAGSFAEIGTEVPHLLWSADLGPDFYSHAQRQLAGLGSVVAMKNMKEVEARRAAVGVPHWLQPSGVTQRIVSSGDAVEEIADSKHIIVANIDALESLLGVVTSTFQRMVDSVKTTPFMKW